MRNLQKILALALALIMSFSLVVTANAAFSDEADISEAYNESVDVLSTLEVFKGYTDGTYQPQKSITRAEVAAIIYRIATGDVADEQVAIYSDWNRFTDVHAGEWWAGYINYCANAEYIKGYGNGKFGPDDPVTGYEALAMILRAVGYGKMDGEFQGSDWAVQTAARANSLKVTRNVQNTALLNSAATRELVAELLCQAILVPTVEYNQFSGYSENDESLAKRSFDMERLEGVVMANEYADLEDDDTLANGKTRLDVDGRDVTLNVTSDLTAIGESRYAYVRKTSNNDYDMVCSKLYDTGNNVINETGAAKDKVKDLVDAKSIKTVDETEYFINFDPDSSIWSSDWRIAYAIPKTAPEANYTEYDKYLAGILADKGTVRIDKLKTEDGLVDAWYRWIAPDEDIPKEDQDIIRDIFYHADLKETEETKLNQVVEGEVYVGTQSVEDVSDTLSFKQFQDRYIKTQLTKFEKTENGNWLKVVDNDNDGIVEYVFKTQCVLDEIVDSVTKDEKTTFYWRSLNTKDIDPAYMDGYEPEVGDVVVYAIIDGKAQMKLAETENATINAISYKDVTATSTEGTVYEQSDIDNETAMDELLVNMDEKVEYVLYKDHFGFIRAYKLAQGNKYALVTEVYPKYSFNSAYVKNTDLIAEVMTADDSSPKEHDVLNSKGNAFFVGSEKETWTHGSRYDKDNWLERAQAHLGLITSPLFDYDKKDTTTGANNYSYTNIARYTMTDDGVNLYTASQFAYDKDGKQWYWGTDEKGNDVKTKDKTDDPVYAVDYVQLAVKDIAKGQRSFDIDTSYENYGHSNGYVNAVNDTEYYLVMDGTIKHIVGRANLPALDVEDNDIRAMYAVAENTSADNVNQDYWVANVIVIELETTSTNYDSISLAFYNFYKRSGSTKYLNTLNNEYAGVELDVIPDEEDWPYQWNGYGFYGLRNTDDTDEAGTVEAELVPIGHQSVARSESYAKHRGYNENGIYAGIVTRVEKDYSRGDYIMANMVNYDGTTTRKELMVNNNQLFAIDEVKSGENEAVDIRIINGDNSELVAGDYIIWVNDSDGDCAFVINLTDKNTYKDHDWTTPDWLYNNDTAINSEWEYIVDSQGQTTVVEKVVSFYGVSDDDGDRKITVSYNTAKAYADQYGEGAENVLNIQPTEIDPATIKVDPAGVTYNAIINGRMYTLTQSAQNTKFGELYSTDDDYAVVTYTNGTPTLHYTDDTATLKTLEDVLETTTGDKISVAGFDAKGNPKSSADAVSEMTSIVVTITNSDGEKRTVTFTDTTLVDASGGSISGFYKLTLSDGVKAYKDNTKAEEYKSGAYLATNTSPYFTSAETGVHGYFKIDSTEYNDAADVDRDEDGYLYFTVSNWKITKDTTVSFVKKAPIDGKIVVAAGSQALKVIENDGSRESDADYFIFVDEWFDTMTPDKNGNPSDPDEVLNQNVKGADKYLDLTGTVEHSNVNRNYFQWVKNWDNGVFTYKAAGEFGGKDDVKTFEFFTIAPADKKVPVISGIGDRVAIKDAGFDSNKTLSISVPEDKSTLHVDEILLDGKGTVLRFTDDSNGTNGLGKEVNLAENTKNTLYVEVECEGGYDSVIYTFEVTRGVVVP